MLLVSTAMANLKKEACFEDILKSLRRVEKQLEELKVSSGGERWLKPRDDNEKVKCMVRCSVMAVGRIDTIRQEFWADVYLSLTWREDALSKRERGEKEVKDIDWNDYWDPQVYFVNAESIDKEERWHSIEDIDDDSAYVKLSIRMRATFTQVMDLRSFPVDYQELTMKLMSDWPIDVVEFEKDCRAGVKDNVRRDTFTDRHEWTLNKNLVAGPVTEDKEETGAINEYPHYHIKMCVWRHYTFYMWNVSIPILLILGLGFAAFAIPPDQGEERLGVTLTLLLTSVAYKYVVSSKLPMISYLTLVEKHVLGCLFIHALLIVQNAVSLVLVVKNVDAAILMDTVSFYVLGFFVLVMTVVVNVVGFRKTFEARSKMNNFGKESKGRNSKVTTENNGNPPETKTRPTTTGTSV